MSAQTVAFGGLPTPVGTVLVAVTETGLVATGFADSSAARVRVAERLALPVVEDPERTKEVRAQLDEYFAGRRREFATALDWRLATRTAQRVLDTLHRTVGFGQVITYGELAARSGTGVPARGIGSIMGKNPIPIVVPCHRVVAGDGLGGFSGGEGVESKRALLTMEGYLPPGLW